MSESNNKPPSESSTPPTKASSSPPQEEEEEEKQEWEIQLLASKKAGDTAFQSSNFTLAIQHYTSALSLDPSHYILYSNRSAAYLSNHEKSRALTDAKECIRLNPTWPKGYNRAGAAMLSLGRYGAAREMYQEALTLDGGKNAVAKKGVAMCWEEERRVKVREMELVKQRQQQQEEEERKMKEEQKREEEKKKEEEKDSTEDDLLDDFFNEVEETNTTTTTATPEPTPTTPEPAPETQSNNISKQLTKLGTPLSQINRLLPPNYEWKNLNPFYVLDIPHTAPLDIISRRYKALSLLIHPDKCAEKRAKEAFEQVRIAMTLLKEEEKRKHVHDLIEQGQKQGTRDYQVSRTTTTNPTLLSKEEEEKQLQSFQEKAIMKVFATIEQKRRDVERRKRAQEKRERDQEEEEKTKVKKEMEFHKRWREGDRVDLRVGSWRDFQGGDGGKKKKKSRWS